MIGLLHTPLAIFNEFGGERHEKSNWSQRVLAAAQELCNGGDTQRSRRRVTARSWIEQQSADPEANLRDREDALAQAHRNPRRAVSGDISLSDRWKKWKKMTVNAIGSRLLSVSSKLGSVRPHHVTEALWSVNPLSDDRKKLVSGVPVERVRDLKLWREVGWIFRDGVCVAIERQGDLTRTRAFVN